jgi:cytidylate kinase
MIVTIDGPAGAGKSSAAKALAQCLGFDFLDTGAMYRAVAFAARQGRIDMNDQVQVERLLTQMRLEMPGGRVVVNSVDVSGQIRTPEITALSRTVADSPVVRQHLSRLQRQIAAGRNLVTEGRDQGTIVFPDAGCKFFLTANPTERARRRVRELQAKGQSVTLEDILRAQTDRDDRDAARAIAPMVPAPDAIQLDSTALSLDEVVAVMEKTVRARM